MSLKAIKNLFVISALYDVVLGILFLLAFKQVYAFFNIALPNHDGYIQFGAAMVAIFGLGFAFVAEDPQRNRAIIKMGILLKAAYASIVLSHWFSGNIPAIWSVFAWFDLAFLVLFVGALRSLPEPRK